MDVLSQIWVEIVKVCRDIAIAAAPILIAALVRAAWAWAKLQLARAKDYRPDLFNELAFLAEHAVHAAEQAGMAGLVQDKKAYALKVIESWLAEKGIDLDLIKIDAAIEAAVWSEINKDAGKTAQAPMGFDLAPAGDLEARLAGLTK